jgi:hypothetical protein
VYFKEIIVLNLIPDSVVKQFAQLNGGCSSAHFGQVPASTVVEATVSNVTFEDGRVLKRAFPLPHLWEEAVRYGDNMIPLFEVLNEISKSRKAVREKEILLLFSNCCESMLSQRAPEVLDMATNRQEVYDNMLRVLNDAEKADYSIQKAPGVRQSVEQLRNECLFAGHSGDFLDWAIGAHFEPKDIPWWQHHGIPLQEGFCGEIREINGKFFLTQKPRGMWEPSLPDPIEQTGSITSSRLFIGLCPEQGLGIEEKSRKPRTSWIPEENLAGFLESLVETTQLVGFSDDMFE